MSAYQLLAFVVVPGLFLVMLLFLKVGYRMGVKRLTEETEQERVGMVSVETAIYGLLGLLVAFTYSGAASRFEARRALIVQEANAIGTAYLRLDLLPSAAQPPLREKMRRYTQTRLKAYQLLPDVDAWRTELAAANAMQQEIWSAAIAALREVPPQSAQLLLPALNDMIDITTTREIATLTQTPGPVAAALVLLAMFCCLLAGYGLAGSKAVNRYLHMLGFALIVTGTIYIILDYDYPRFGLIRNDYADQAIAATLASMK
ncbi:MAG TPA: hypothetical protein VKF40_30505 [Burkholderiales bacterium]|nr:hypothetical protein [Burkholderiales bacterium]